MVFESLVVELINKFVGDYVENLDASQLKLGIWGGDAVLQNLDLKESALDDLDLPVKIKAGHVGKLTLKIPWKNLYTEPVIAQIDGIYALAVPNAGIKYNAEKEEKALQEAKQKKLKQIEERKKAEAEKGKPKEEKADTFVEKMATQVIKNLQIKVNNIHVRYEDAFTNPKQPFAFGVTLQELLFQTTDEKWQPCVIKDTVTQIFKLIKLDALGVYWNSCTKMLSALPKEEILPTLKSSLSSQNVQTDCHYLLKPISSVAHLKLNPKPEKEKFSLPKLFMTLVFDNIAVVLAKLQFDDMLEMLEAFERTALLGLYRKYKPDVPLHKHAKAWWHYAYSAVLEETVRRRRRMFSWQHIIEHRKTMKEYREAYVKKLDKGKASGDVQKTLDRCEKFLDVFSITLMRQQAEVEAAKLGAKRKEEKGSGWFGGLFGGKKKKETGKANNDIQEKFYEQFTADEKNKLYSAIGYEENEADPTLPVEFVAVRLVTKLSNVSVTLKDSKKDCQILRLQLKDVFTSVGQRPAASAVSVEAKIDRMSVFGTPQDNVTPKMVTSLVQEADQVYSLLTVNLETNPLDGLADTRVNVKSRPLEIAYNAVTVNQLADFFKPPESVRLKQLSQAAMAKFDEIKEQSATGLQHAIEQHKYTEINVDLMSSYVLVPEGGVMKKDAKMLLLDLGQLKVTSEKNQSHQIKGKMDSLEEVMARAYDKFNIQLARIQLLLVHPGEDWHKARWLGESNLHILRPISILINLQKCMFDKDPRMAKMKVAGELPLLGLSISDYRLQEILALAQSIPVPESAPPPDDIEEELAKAPSAMVTVAGDEGALLNRASKLAMDEESKGTSKTVQRTTSQEFINATDMELKFEIKQICISVAEREGNEEKPLLKLVIMSVGTQVKMRTFDMVVEAFINSLSLQHLKFSAGEGLAEQLKTSRGITDTSMIPIVSTPANTGIDRLLMVQFVKANKDGPEFATTYKNTEQSISIVFSGLELLLHQAAILNLMEFAQKLQPPPTSKSSAPAEKQKEKEKEKAKDKCTEKKTPKQKKEKPEDPNIIDIMVKAEMKCFAVGVATDDKLITDIRIQGIDANVAVQKAQTTVGAVLKEMIITDPTAGSLYPKILSIEGSEVLKLDLVAYNNGTAGEKYGDMTCVDTKVEVAMGCIKVVFLNRYVTELLAFLDNFQAAKDKMAEAGEAMAEYSAEAVQSLQETASRISLNIAMKAPLIIVPQKSTSTSVLLADLGNLEIKNSFHLAGQSSPSGVPPVLDKMNIVLTSLKLSRATLDPSGSVKAEILLLEPVTIALYVNRNLSAAWYHKHPDLDLGGTLEAVSVKLSQGDFTVMMCVLNENLTEGQAPAAAQKPSTAVVVEPSMKAESAGKVSASPGGEKKPETAPPAVPATAEVYTKMKFNFKIKSVSVTLYSGETKLTSGICKREAIKSLSKVALLMFALDGSMMSDTSMNTTVILKDMVLDDLRPQSQSGITRLIQRSHQPAATGGAHTPNMIDVSFQQNDKQDKNIMVKMSSLQVCVCVEFLMTLGDFFTKGMPQTPKPAVEPAPAAADKTSAAAKPAAAAEPPASELTVILEMEKPDIILVEDQLNTSSNALMLNLGLNFKLRNTPEVQSMQASISKLQILSCLFNKRDKPNMEVLPACDISFISSAPYGKDHHMDIQITDIVFNISPAIISTMAAISAGFATKPAEEGGDAEQALPPAGLWDVKKIQDCSFWYINTVKGKGLEEAPEADETSDDSSVDESQTADALVNGEIPEETGPVRGEQLLLNLPSLVIKLEGGVGHRTVPLLIVESSFQAEVRDWSSKLCVESSLLLEVAYYNEKLAVWEPLVEPVIEDGKGRRWELSLGVTQNDDLPPLPPEDAEDTVVMPLPKMSVSIRSTDSLQLTMSKACLEVLTNLGKAFSDAYNLTDGGLKLGEVVSPYVFENHTGMDIVLKLDTAFETPTHAVSGRVKLQSGKTLPVSEKLTTQASTKASVIKATQEGVERKIIFLVEEFAATREVTIKRAEKRLFQINKLTPSGEKWAIVANTQAVIGQKIVALQSVIQVKNHLAHSVEVYFRGEVQTESCGVAPPGGLFNIPLHAVYASSGDFFFRPVDGYDMCKESFKWRAAENESLKQCACSSRQAGHSPLYFNIQTETENIYFEAGEEPTAKSHVLHLRPTAVLHNLLPFPIKYLLGGMAEQEPLDKGCNIPLFNASINESSLEITIPDYMGKEWVGRRTLEKNVPELSVWGFESHDGTKTVDMDLGLHCKMNQGSFDVTLYSPYWMLNKTGQSLCYKGTDSEVVLDHPADCEDVVLFSFKAKTLFGSKKKEEKKNGTLERKGKVKEMKQSGKSVPREEEDPNAKEETRTGKCSKVSKAQLKIGDTNWSDKFSLDTVGSSGTVQCKSEKRVFEVGVKISLTSSGLTKVVTFTPFFLLLNTAEHCIQCKESSDTWVDVVPGKCLPFWPEQSGKEMTMVARVKDTEETTKPFLFNKAHISLMRLDNKFGGLSAECSVTESAMVTTLKSYKPGMATVQMVNFTDKCPVTFNQSGVKTVHELGAGQTQLYTWEDSLGKNEIMYTCGNKKDVKNDLSQDGIGEFFFNSDTKIYWVSFLDGMQRVLMFTEDLAVATIAQQAGELERIELEVTLSIQGLGLSLVNNYNQTEIAFLGITSSGIIWEEKRKRYKAIKVKDGMVLENAFQRYLNELAVGRTPNGRMQLENKFDVDFTNYKEKMMMFKPNKREIRRSFVDGIWVQYKTSAHQLQLHAKINRLQLDCQLKGAVFPTILAPIPPPKSVAAESVPKPFTEVSLMQRKHEHSDIAQIKYFKVLIQEFAVKVDQGFLNATLELFSSGEPVSREQETKDFSVDMKKTESKLMDVVGLSLAEEQKNFYDYLHLSPIKIHLGFSLQAGGGDGSGKPTQLHSNVFNVFMQSVGVVLTDAQDLIFKLGYFERSHRFYNQSQLVGEMTRHYAGQAIKQMYVLVLGLDVLGNPFGLLRGLSEGVTDLFYEPCQGAIQGPEEFAEGLALGVRSLFGHAVGGAAGAVSKITGTLGKGMAALTLDDEYQKKRREQLNKRPASAREGIARGGKGLVMGVFDGVTGIVRKPIEGAQEEGAKGFFKGIGKGLVGVVTRPTSGVIDFASSSFEGIRRIAEMSDEVRRLRPPRRFHSDMVIRPYNPQEAEGYAILHETEKGKYAATDEYVAHAVVSKDGKQVFLVLDKRLLLAKRGEIFGSWDCEWMYTWSELKEPPKKVPKGIEIILKEKEKKKFFGSSTSKKEVHIADPNLAEKIVSKIDEAMANYR